MPVAVFAFMVLCELQRYQRGYAVLCDGVKAVQGKVEHFRNLDCNVEQLNCRHCRFQQFCEVGLLRGGKSIVQIVWQNLLKRFSFEDVEDLAQRAKDRLQRFVGKGIPAIIVKLGLILIFV